MRRSASVAASNRAGQVYLLPGARVDAAGLARRLDGFAAVDVSLRREGDEVSFPTEGLNGGVSMLAVKLG